MASINSYGGRHQPAGGGRTEAYVHGVSTRSVDDLNKAMGISGESESQVSRLWAELDERVGAFLNAPFAWMTAGSSVATRRT